MADTGHGAIQQLHLHNRSARSSAALFTAKDHVNTLAVTPSASGCDLGLIWGAIWADLGSDMGRDHAERLRVRSGKVWGAIWGRSGPILEVVITKITKITEI